MHVHAVTDKSLLLVLACYVTAVLLLCYYCVTAVLLVRLLSWCCYYALHGAMCHTFIMCHNMYLPVHRNSCFWTFRLTPPGALQDSKIQGSLFRCHRNALVGEVQTLNTPFVHQWQVTNHTMSTPLAGD